MSVSNGQTANQTTFNNAFMSRTTNTSTVGKVDLSNVASESGSSIVNSQRELNALASFTGKSINVAKDNIPAWSENNIGASGDSLFDKVDAIDVFIGDGVLIDTGTQVFTGAKTFTNLSASGVFNVVAQTYALNDTNLALPTNPLVRLSTGDETFVYGIAPSSTGQLIILHNDTGVDITVSNESGSATSASYRITTGTGEDLVLVPGTAIWLYYDLADSRWQIVGGSGGGASTQPEIANLRVFGKDGYGPIESFNATYFHREFSFEKATSQSMIISFRVPASYQSVELTLKGRVKASVGTGDVVVGVNSSILRGATSETVAFSTTLSGLTTTNSDCEINLMQAAGLLNDYSLTEGDLVVFEVLRDSTNVSDTLVGDWIVAPESLEVSEAL